MFVSICFLQTYDKASAAKLSNYPVRDQSFFHSPNFIKKAAKPPRVQRKGLRLRRRLYKKVVFASLRGQQPPSAAEGCGGALRAHYKMAPQALTLPPWSGLYNYPLNQPGRRNRSRAAAQGQRPGGGPHLLNHLAFGNTGIYFLMGHHRQVPRFFADAQNDRVRRTAVSGQPPAIPLSHFLTFSLSHCLTIPLSHCHTSPLAH